MKVLHITPHLGGGVGKALQVISEALPKGKVEQTFVLLEQPINKRHVNAIVATDSEVVVAVDLAHVSQLARQADIVQFEFINHPRIFECLARTDFPAMRSIIWAHISGLFKPFIQPGLVGQVNRFVFTSEVSFDSAMVNYLDPADFNKLAVINSGFGFTENVQHVHVRRKKLNIGYLGTVNFVKMHKLFFDVLDHFAAMQNIDLQVSIWGEIDQSVVEYANTKRQPGRFIFYGETPHPAAALSSVDIFFYPLQPNHYGTGENSLIEAMSLGLPCVVMNNQAENEIIEHGKTGFIANAFDDCVSILHGLMVSPDLRRQVGLNAIDFVQNTRTPSHSVFEFLRLWHTVLEETPVLPDFKAAIGSTPAAWFMGTQWLPGVVAEPIDRQSGSTKGSLRHFEKVFAGDESFAQLLIGGSV
jgi:glycosyltransferase involved in cell wall biosynthesis